MSRVREWLSENWPLLWFPLAIVAILLVFGDDQATCSLRISSTPITTTTSVP